MVPDPVLHAEQHTVPGTGGAEEPVAPAGVGPGQAAHRLSAAE